MDWRSRLDQLRLPLFWSFFTVSLLGYLYFESIFAYQLASLGCILLLAGDYFQRRSAGLFLLYGLFLVASAGFYALQYDFFPPWVALTMAILGLGLLYSSGEQGPPFPYGLLTLALGFTELVLLFSYYRPDPLARAAILSGLVGLALPRTRHQLLSYWPFRTIYGIVVLLFLLFSGLYLRHTP